jgi:hypothetical protein
LSWAFDEFAAGFRAGRIDNAQHRFWRLVESVEERLDDALPGATKARWQLEATFFGHEHDQLDLELHRRAAAGRTGALVWAGPFVEFLQVEAQQIPVELAQARDRGLLVLGEALAGRAGRLARTGSKPPGVGILQAIPARKPTKGSPCTPPI